MRNERLIYDLGDVSDQYTCETSRNIKENINAERDRIFKASNKIVEKYLIDF